MSSPFEITINSDCQNCGKCIRSCDRGNFFWTDEGEVGVRNDYVCIGCLKCSEWCAFHAISIKPMGNTWFIASR